MTDPRIQVVGDGYDAIAERYLEWTKRIQGDPKLQYVDELSRRLRPGARVLELGCGSGEPCTRLLAERFDVTGIDVSEEQIRRARANVPAARFIEADFMEVEFEGGSLDAVAAFYVLNHLPRERLGELFVRVHGWLAPGGLFLASLGIGDEDAWTGDWLGTTMFFSSFPRDMNNRLLDEAGFERLLDEVVTIVEPEPDGEATFQWVLCRR